jgi:hypothetical protein
MNSKQSLSRYATSFARALIASAVALPATVYAGPKACSEASLSGSFGFYRNGSTAIGPLAALGILHFDGRGTVGGSQSISRNGTFQFDVPVPPSPYQVNEDCTARFLSPDGTTEVARVVVFDGGKGFYVFSETAGNAVTGVGRKISEFDDGD